MKSTLTPEERAWRRFLSRKPYIGSMSWVDARRMFAVGFRAAMRVKGSSRRDVMSPCVVW